MSIREVARRSEGAFGPSYVSQLEKGIAPWSKVSLMVIRGFARAFSMTVEELLEHVDGRAEAHRRDDLTTGRKIPVFEMVGAGEPLDGGNLINYVQIPLSFKGEYAAYEIEGESMSPRIPNKSIVIVKLSSSVKPRDTVVCYVPDEGMLCKEVRSIEPDGTWVLASFNPNFSPIYSRDVEVMGVVEEVRIPYR